jgi:hypothetical protein
MEKLRVFVLFASSSIVLLAGCANPGPITEEPAVDLDRQQEVERQQGAFRKSLPPVTNPGRDQ